jgi:phosphonate transport system substrate-binding protein
MANQKYKAQAKITFLRSGKDTYQSQIIARADSKVKSLKDIDGKKFAFVDPASASGYLMPAKLFADNKIKPAQTVFANKHDNVVMMVYQKQVDAGATYYSAPQDGKIEDARQLVLAQYPDIEEKVKIIQLTDPIPNDPIVMRADLDEKMKSTVVDALIKFMDTPEGQKSLKEVFGITGMIRSSDERYDGVREILKTLGKDVAELSKK